MSTIVAILVALAACVALAPGVYYAVEALRGLRVAPARDRDEEILLADFAPPGSGRAETRRPRNGGNDRPPGLAAETASGHANPSAAADESTSLLGRKSKQPTLDPLVEFMAPGGGWEAPYVGLSAIPEGGDDETSSEESESNGGPRYGTC